MLAKFLRARIAKLSVVAVLTLLAIVSGAWFASMKAATPQETNCQAVVPGKIYQFIEGIDTCATPMSNSDIEKLTDSFATALLRKGIFPESVDAMSEAIAKNLGYSPTIFLLGEGAQIPTTFASRDDSRGLRSLITWGPTENEGKIMMSKLVPVSKISLTEVMSFDDRTKKYNYYFLQNQAGASDDSQMVWAWKGNSSLARKPQTMGKSCFRCHHNGVPLMREIETPWNNWQSQRVIISSALVPKAVASESYFLPRRNAEILEELVRGSVQHYYRDWLEERSRKEGGTTYLSDISDMLRHLTTTTTINFKSSEVQSNGKDTSPTNLDIIGVPPRDTFLSDTLFQTTLGLNYSSLSVTLPRKDYDAYLKKHNFKLVGTKGFYHTSGTAFEYPGSTYFAYFVPQVPAEDVYVTQLLLQSKVVTDKFVGALLMVDYKNPLFSDKRASLQKYAEKMTTGTLVNGVSSVPKDFVAKIKETGAKACNANNFDTCSAEEQFLYTWELPDDQWKQLSAKRMQGYVDSVANLEPNERLDRLMRRSVEQRDRFLSTPALCEFYESKLLFPETDLSKVPSCPSAH
ncbi:hypothetical protein [Kamptonema sp. UHCC 0994]|uniref:hypothetical protein n=1 Tax=Kamptonema sp. UHCC 0994 TaxID=3031329 RepID=UPI0023BA8E19|nr:hypothetical protein [Kamptonema sp. UHCC 0994]MDF0556153.1 hypothetical protein [Kamptonema sp. UHCC 0994]